MPTMLASELAFRASSIGAAAWEAFADSERRTLRLRVHSIFASTLNLEVEGSDILVALSGKAGAAHPHAVTLSASDFPSWPLGRGDRGLAAGTVLSLEGRGAEIRVDLGRARRLGRPEIVRIARLGAAVDECEARLEEFQNRRRCDLRLAMLRKGETPGSAMGQELLQGARDLGRALLPDAGGGDGDVTAAVSSLVGRGPGLTPSGDDFLCGFLAALDSTSERRAAGTTVGFPSRGFVAVHDALSEAIERRLFATGEISASLLRCAMRGYWFRPLAELSDALARDLDCDARNRLDELCGLGHSSGADMATGFFYGLRRFVESTDDQAASSPV